MPTISVPRKVYAAGALVLAAAAAAGLLGQRPARAEPLTQSVADEQVAKAWEKFHYQPARQCKKCHTAPREDDKESLELVTLTEYSIWQTHDKHAQAYAVLKGPRGEQIGKVLKQDVLAAETGCLNCHGMSNLSKVNAPKDEKDRLKLDDGISCGGCHGPSGGPRPAEAWVNLHVDKTWRKMSPADKYKAGLRDLRDPVIRAELCLSCHVGNAAEGKVVSHAMMAAGHPPLPPVEIATFSRNEPQHWRNAARVPAFRNPSEDDVKNYHLEDLDFNQTRFALAGTVVAVRETFRLARQRADVEGTLKLPRDAVFPELATNTHLGKSPKERWPEIAMAHSDCFACHHDLKYPGYRQERGFGYFVPKLDAERVVPGRPVVRTWPLAGLAVAAAHTGTDLGRLKEGLKALAAATNARPFGDPDALGAASKELVGWCDSLLGALRPPEGRITRTKAIKLARTICTLWDDGGAGRLPAPDYESARQMASLLLVVCGELKVNSKDATKAMDDLRTYLDTEPYYRRPDRVKVLMQVMNETLPKPDNPARYKEGQEAFEAYLKDIGSQEALQKMVGGKNQFLSTLGQDFNITKFTENLLKGSVVKQLQGYSDEEEDRTLRTIARYDPETFKKLLKALLPHIPSE